MRGHILIVLCSEIRKGSPNPRLRRTSSLRGGIITIESPEKVCQGDVFSLSYQDKERYYRAEEISTIADSENVEVALVEYGYWADYPSKNREFDVRELMGLPVSRVTDSVLLKNIATANNYT